MSLNDLIHNTINGNIEIVRSLIKNGIDVNLKHKCGRDERVYFKIIKNTLIK
jgi:ankyrin repeat protein